MILDAAAERGPLAESLRMLAAERPEQFPGALGSAATPAFAVAVRGWLVGLRDDAVAVLGVCRDWLRRSLAEDERSGDAPLLTAATVADTLAATDWLLDGHVDPERYRDALTRYRRYLRYQPGADVRDDIARLELAARSPRAGGDRRRARAELHAHGARWLAEGHTVRVVGWLAIATADGERVVTPDEALWSLLPLLA